MPPSLAQVLNTLAHEIRTPLAVSQGYLKLYLDGRLTERRRCAARVSADAHRARHARHALHRDGQGERAVGGLVARAHRARHDARLHRASCRRRKKSKAPSGPATAARRRLPRRAPRILAKRSRLSRKPPLMKRATSRTRCVWPASELGEGASELVMLAGTPDAIPALEAGPDAVDARQVDFARGGKGLRLIWAAFVLQRHHVQTWTHQGHRAAVGFRFPLVQA